MRYVFKFNKGLSLVEVLISLALVSLVGVLAAKLISTPLQVAENLTLQLDDDAILEIRVRELIRRIERSQVMRRGYFSCPPPDDSMPAAAALNNLLITQQAFPQGADPDNPPPAGLQDGASKFNGRGGDIQFSVVYSQHSSLVAESNRLSGRLRVFDPRSFPVGALIVLSSVDQPNFGGVFRIDDVDPVERTVFLGKNLNFVSQMGCQVNATASAMGFSAFAADNRNALFGEKSPVFRADVVRIAKYSSEVKGNRRTLTETVWPVFIAPGAVDPADPSPGFTVPVDEGEAQTFEETLQVKQVVTTLFERLEVSGGKWQPDGKMGSGRFQANLRFFLTDLNKGNRNVAAEDRIMRSFTRRVSYNDVTGGRRNFVVSTSGGANIDSYPSCGVKIEPISDKILNADGSFASFFSVTGFANGQQGAAALNLEFVAGTGGAPECWYAASIVDNPGGFQSPDETKTLTVGATLIANQPEGIVCRAPAGGASFESTMAFFSPAVGTVREVTCSGSVLPAPASFQYLGAASCFKAKSIKLREIVQTGTTKPGPTQFLNASSCEYTDNLGTREECGKPGRDLASVRAFPTGITGINSDLAVCP